MKKTILFIVTGIFCITLSAGCGSLKTGAKKKSPEEIAALEESAVRGEDIPLESIPDVRFEEPVEAGVVGVFEDVHFAYDKSRIMKKDYEILNQIGKWLKNNPDASLMIEGHCDERGANEYNMALGEQRALSVRRYLIGLGIDSSRLHTVSYGEEKPVDPGHNEKAWSKNRRTHFLIAQ